MWGPILKRVGIGVVLATLLVVAVGFMLPSSYTVSRSVVIEAPIAHIHELCGNLKTWPDWAPWHKADPTMAVTYGQVTSGVGAHQSWAGESGDGELTFTRSDPAWGIAYEMYLDGRSHRADGSLRYNQIPDGVEVVWSMNGDHGWNILSRYFGLTMDYLVGPMFDDGLARLKTLAEGP